VEPVKAWVKFVEEHPLKLIAGGCGAGIAWEEGFVKPRFRLEVDQCIEKHKEIEHKRASENRLSGGATVRPLYYSNAVQSMSIISSLSYVLSANPGKALSYSTMNDVAQAMERHSGQSGINPRRRTCLFGHSRM
jgi:hypothetical protein